MLTIDAQSAIRFVRALTGATTDDSLLGNLCVQTFPDDRSKSSTLAKKYFCATLIDFKKLIPRLIDLNNDGAGIFVAINETDGKGRLFENITAVRSLAVDLDGAPLKNIKEINHPPHIVVESSAGKYHAYWKTSDVPLSLFMPFQQHLARVVDGDKSVCDLPRVLRVPGFWHQKDANNKFQTKLLHPVDGVEPEPPISLELMLTAAKTSVGNLRGNTATVVEQKDLPKLALEQIRPIVETIVSRRAEMTHVAANMDKSRNQNAVYLGFELRAAGVPQQDAGTLGVDLYLKLARTTNSKGQEEPLTEDEVRRAINNAYLPNKVQLAPKPKAPRTPQELINTLNEKFFVVEQPFGIFQEGEDDELISYRLSDFSALLKPESVFDEGKNKVLLADQVWLSSKHRRTYSKIVMVPPPLVPPARSLNLWRGFDYEPKKGDCSKFMQHIKEIVCDNDPEKFKFFWNWWAQAIQEPGKKPGTTLVLRGLPGCGKGATLDTLGKLFGRHYLHLTHHDSLTKNFNAQLQNKLIVFADEMTWGGNRKDTGTLKGIITEDVISIEPKYRDAYSVDNHLRLVIASNETWAVPVGLHDRRFFVLDVAATHCKDTKYFDSLFNELNNGGREALLYELLNTPLDSSVDLRKPPMTQGKAELAFNTMRGIEAFLVDVFSERNLLPHSGANQYTDEHRLKGDWNREDANVSLASQYESYVRWCQLRREQIVNMRSFQMKLKYLMPSLGNGYIQYHTAEGKHKLIKSLKYPMIQVAAEEFSSKVGMQVKDLIGDDLPDPAALSTEILEKDIEKWPKM